MNPIRSVMLAGALGAAACGSPEGSAAGDPWTTLDGWEEHQGSAIEVVGVVEWREIEGGTWVIRESGGAVWAPVNLPESFQIDGAGVVADVRLRPDLMSIGMTGELVEILRIRPGAVAGAPSAAPGGTPEAEPAGPVPGSDIFGEWRVVDAHQPGVSAMAGSRAANWRGRAFVYGPRQARSPDGDCVDVSFSERTVSIDALLSGQYGVPPESLPPVAGLDEVAVVEVRCGGASWNAVGQTVVLLDDRRALTPWDGVFFELHRTR